MKRVIYSVFILIVCSFVLVNAKAADMSFSEIGTKLKNAASSMGSLDGCYASTVTTTDNKITITYTVKDILNGCEDPTGWKLVFEKQGSNIVMNSSMPTSTDRNYNHLLTQDIYWFEKFFSILKYNKKFSELASMDASTLKNNYNLVLTKKTFNYTPRTGDASNAFRALDAYYEAFNVYTYNNAIKEALASDSNLSGGLQRRPLTCKEYNEADPDNPTPHQFYYNYDQYTLKIPTGYYQYSADGSKVYGNNYSLFIGVREFDLDNEACGVKNQTYGTHTVAYNNPINTASYKQSEKQYDLRSLSDTVGLFNGEIYTNTLNVYNNATANLTSANNYPGESKSLNYLSSFTYTLKTDSSSSSSNTGNTGNNSSTTIPDSGTTNYNPTISTSNIGTSNVGTANTGATNNGASVNKPIANDNKAHDNGLEKVPSNPKTGYAIPIIILLSGIIVAAVIILKTKNKNLFKKI